MVRLGYWSLAQEATQWLQTGYGCSKVSKAKYTNTGLFEQFLLRLLSEISIEMRFEPPGRVFLGLRRNLLRSPRGPICSILYPLRRMQQDDICTRCTEGSQSRLKWAPMGVPVEFAFWQ